MSRTGSAPALQSVLVGGLLGLDLLLAHLLSRRPDVGGWEVLLAALPVSALGLLALYQALGRRAAALGLLAVAILVWSLFGVLQHHIAWLYFLQHIGVNLALGTWFGRSLLEQREPLCTTFASLLHPVMHARLRHYTYRLTQLWTGFFFLMAIVSVLLFAFAPVAVWSVFANLLTLPLVVLVFVVEYLVRIRVLPAQDRVGITSAFRAYRQTLKGQRPDAERTRETPGSRA